MLFYFLFIFIDFIYLFIVFLLPIFIYTVLFIDIFKHVCCILIEFKKLPWIENVLPLNVGVILQHASCSRFVWACSNIIICSGSFVVLCL